jgi:hypothetical protein
VVNIVRLIESIRRVMWRHGAVAGDRIDHRVDERGDHHLEITIPAELAEYEPTPRHLGREIHPWGLGPSVAAMPSKPKK